MRTFFSRHKYLYDNGANVTSQMAGVVNMALLILATSEKLERLTGLNAGTLAILATVGYLAGTWAIGYFLDSTRFLETYNEEAAKRTPMLQRIEAGVTK